MRTKTKKEKLEAYREARRKSTEWLLKYLNGNFAQIEKP